MCYICPFESVFLCHTHKAYMLAGWAEPLPIWNQHKRRPQTGSVVAAITRVAQQNLRTHTHTQIEITLCIHSASCDLKTQTT